jgi:hypothetical protein
MLHRLLDPPLHADHWMASYGCGRGIDRVRLRPLGAVAQAIQSHGLSTAVIGPAIAAFVMSFIATASPSMRTTDGKAHAGAECRDAAAALLSALVGGCVTAKKIAYDAAACALGQVPAAVSDTVEQAKASLMGAQGAPSWVTFAETMLLAKGSERESASSKQRCTTSTAGCPRPRLPRMIRPKRRSPSTIIHQIPNRSSMARTGAASTGSRRTA